MRVNEIFYSLQGEGFHTGVPAVFVRLSGCNLRCPFCDTDFEKGREMSAEEIAREVGAFPASHVVITGGEPTLQLNSCLLTLLKEQGKYVQIETNGTNSLPEDVIGKIDWVTCSPKGAPLKINRIDELKVVFGGSSEVSPEDFGELIRQSGCVASLQPCDTGSEQQNRTITRAAIDYVLRNPIWRLSLQTHKILLIQ